jgi:hypothetical protein
MRQCRVCGKLELESDLEGPYCLKCEKINMDGVMGAYHELSGLHQLVTVQRRESIKYPFSLYIGRS